MNTTEHYISLESDWPSVSKWHSIPSEKYLISSISSHLKTWWTFLVEVISLSCDDVSIKFFPSNFFFHLTGFDSIPGSLRVASWWGSGWSKASLNLTEHACRFYVRHWPRIYTSLSFCTSPSEVSAVEMLFCSNTDLQRRIAVHDAWLDASKHVQRCHIISLNSQPLLKCIGKREKSLPYHK